MILEILTLDNELNAFCEYTTNGNVEMTPNKFSYNWIIWDTRDAWMIYGLAMVFVINPQWNV